jgi:hypothetical protein
MPFCITQKALKSSVAVNELGVVTASSTAISQEIFNHSNEMKLLKTDLAYIHINFSFLSQSIIKLEKTTHLFSKINQRRSR